MKPLLGTTARGSLRRMQALVGLALLLVLPGRIAAADTTAGPSIDRRIGLPCGDCDGIAVGDINRNGRIDILASNGKGGTTFWFEQGESPWEWTRHEIFSIPETPHEIEGNDLGDFNGDGQLEAISLDQPGGKIWLHRAGEDPRERWQTVPLRTDRPLVQASLVADVDGDGRDDLIYTWEGNREGSGGMHWLKFTGTDLLDPEHWSDHVMVSLESTWWIAPGRLDLNGNGRETDIVFTARNLPRRNPGAKPGVYWLEEPEDVTRPWKLHVIDSSLEHPLHVDVGDFSGDGNGKDVLVGGFSTDRIVWYRFSRDWERHELVLPPLSDGSSPDRIWNVKGISYGAPRSGILAPVNRGGQGRLLFFAFENGEYRPHELLTLDYGHPMDDRILLLDLDGDGQPEALIPDSGPRVNRLWIMKFDFGT